MGERHQTLYEPQPIIIHTPERVPAWLDAADDQPLACNRDRHSRNIDAGIHAEQRNDFLEQARIGIGEQHVAHEHAEPLRRQHRHDDGQRRCLREAAEETAHQWRRVERQVPHRGRGGAFAVEDAAYRAQCSRRIHVLQRYRSQSVRCAHRGDKSCREQRVPAELGEKVRVEGNGLRRQHALCCG